MFGAALGFPVTLCVPANVSPERKHILTAYGAEVVWTNPADGSDGAIRKARELIAADPDKYFYADQYGNENNWREIAKDNGLLSPADVTPFENIWVRNSLLRSGTKP